MGESKRRRQAVARGADTRRPKTGAGAGRFRLTWRTVGLFLLAMLILDILLYSVFRFAFDQCYAVLCLLE